MSAVAVAPAWPLEPCRSCGAPVIWAVTERGKAMPVDAEPSSAGTIELQWRERSSGLPGGAPPLAHSVPYNQRARRTDLRTSHFATCPQAPSWRKRGRP